MRRESLLFAYLKSLACIIIAPARAARGLAIPDGRTRCVRWALVHLLLATSAAALLSDGQEYVRWTANRIWPPTSQLRIICGFPDPPVDRVIVWAGHSLLAWTLSLVLAMGIACLISYYTPGRHRAAKLSGVKWSLYLTPLFLLPLAGWYGFYFVFQLQSQAAWPFAFRYGFPPPDIPLWLMIAPYGVWWAIGIAANQYNRVRGWGATIGYVLAFFAVWLVLTHVLFAPGPLEALR